jgi:hypothetical protein
LRTAFKHIWRYRRTPSVLKTELAGHEFIIQHGVQGIHITELLRYGRTKLEAWFTTTFIPMNTYSLPRAFQNS